MNERMDDAAIKAEIEAIIVELPRLPYLSLREADRLFDRIDAVEAIWLERRMLHGDPTKRSPFRGDHRAMNDRTCLYCGKFLVKGDTLACRACANARRGK